MLVANTIQDLENYGYKLKRALNNVRLLRNMLFDIEETLPRFKQALELAEMILMHKTNANGDQIDAKE